MMGQLSLTTPPFPDIQLLQQEISASEELSQQLFLELVDLYSVQVGTHTHTHAHTYARNTPTADHSTLYTYIGTRMMYLPHIGLQWL